MARWSNAEIARQLIALSVVFHIAAGTVGRWLATAKLKPWRYHAWQHILDPHAFLERARPILWLYQRAKVWSKGASGQYVWPRRHRFRPAEARNRRLQR